MAIAGIKRLDDRLSLVRNAAIFTLIDRSQLVVVVDVVVMDAVSIMKGETYICRDPIVPIPQLSHQQQALSLNVYLAFNHPCQVSRITEARIREK